MNASLLAVLNDAERLLVAETERAPLAVLDEDAAIELATRIRRARNKYVGQYRRAASAAKQSRGPDRARAVAAATRKGPTVTGEPKGDRALRSPASEKQRASTRAMGARRQAKRDSR
jgi:hypothetical protein